MRSEVKAAVQEVLHQRWPACRIAGMDEAELADILATAIDAGVEKALELRRSEIAQLVPSSAWRAEA